MGSVQSTVVCPLCCGECMEEYYYKVDYASYFCHDCGYSTNTDVAESSDPEKKLRETVSKRLMPFVKWAEFGEESGAVVRGCFPWWPAGLEVVTEYIVTPIVVKGKLLWRRYDIEPIPEEERKSYPRKDGEGYYQHRLSEAYADYACFSEAMQASREDNLAKHLLQHKRLSIKPLGRKSQPAPLLRASPRG